MKRLLGTIAISILVMSVGGFATAQEMPLQTTSDGVDLEGGIDFFEQRVAPILKRRCYACHSHEAGKAKGGLVLDSRHGWQQGGSEGAAIVPGEPNRSLLMSAVRYETYEMPPDRRLPADEIAVLDKWIAMGAPDPRQSNAPAIDPEKLWALQPISNPSPPNVDDTGWARDGLDAFILSELEARGLRPAGRADRYTLLRRVTFDLTGLPPTPEEIEAFVTDTSDRAYEKVVDRLLTSVAFGDHWARHWLDLSCYADLADIQGNVLIRDAWRYRDYVIDAFNSDKPLDLFIHEQIAGDLLPSDDVQQRRDQLIATGFLAIGPWTLQNYIKAQLASDVVDHQIDRIGRIFLGQTLSCARCHDHKFDPVPTRDYYALAGIFHSTLTTRHDGPGVWSQINQASLPASPNAVAEFERYSRQARRQQRELRQELESLQRAELTRRLTSAEVHEHSNSLSLNEGIPANEVGREYSVSFDAGPTVWAAASQATNEQDRLLIQLLRPDDTVLAGHLHTSQSWPGGAESQPFRTSSFVYTGDGSGDVTVRITAADSTGRFAGAVDNLKIVEVETSREIFTEDFDRFQLGSIEGNQANTGLPVYAKCSLSGWTGAGTNHSHVVDCGSQGNSNLALQVFSGPPVSSANPRIAAIHTQLHRIDQRLDELRPDRLQALVVRDIEQPQDSPIYRRGDFQALGDRVPRGFLSAVTVSRHHEIPEQASGRLQLAQWLTDPGNPLTARVLVNRIWHHLFGQGLVRTVDYFGVHGESPSHPELLDFLATRFREDDRWSLKQTVRRLVLSTAYQMASTHELDASRIDPENRWLWRMPRRRLTAESIRDTMLAVSGTLDRGRGGPSLSLDLKDNIAGLGGNVNPPTWVGKIANEIRHRRSVYLPLKRERPTGELEILSIFDFPHPNDITGARPHTTVSTQALFLLNAPFVKQQAVRLSERLRRDQPDDEAMRIDRLYLLAFGRPATIEEIELAQNFLHQCAQEFTETSPSPDVTSAAWTQLCHAILASNAFLFYE